jgi:hypothetical protein
MLKAYWQNNSHNRDVQIECRVFHFVGLISYSSAKCVCVWGGGGLKRTAIAFIIKTWFTHLKLLHSYTM